MTKLYPSFFLHAGAASRSLEPRLNEFEFSERTVRGARVGASAPLVVSAIVAYLLPVHRGMG
jgi:hypothetical protein